MCWAWSVRSCFGPFLINPDWMKWHGGLNTEFGRTISIKTIRTWEISMKIVGIAIGDNPIGDYFLKSYDNPQMTHVFASQKRPLFWVSGFFPADWGQTFSHTTTFWRNVPGLPQRIPPAKVALSCKACELDLVVGVLMRRVRYLDPSLSGSCSRHRNPGGWHRFVLRCDILAWAHEGSRLDNGKWLCSLSHLIPFVPGTHLQLPSSVSMATNISGTGPLQYHSLLRPLTRSSGVQHLSGLSCAPREGSGRLDVEKPTVKNDLRPLRIFSENWMIPGLERFNTVQNGSKRFKTVQWCPKAFRKMRNAETPLSWTWPFLGDRGEDGLPVDWTFKGIRLRDWAQFMSVCIEFILIHSASVLWSLVKACQSGDLGWFGDVRWKLSHLEVLVQIFSPTVQWQRTQAWIVAQDTH